MIKPTPPSVVGPYDLISSFDSAIDWPEPPDRAPDESDDDYKARIARDFEPRQAEFSRLLTVARETGQWSGVLKPGDEPTRFRVKQLPPSVAVQWDRVTDAMSPLERGALAIRCVIISATGWIPGFTVGRSVEHAGPDGRPSGLGRVAPFDVIESFYAHAPGDVAERLIIDLGGQIINRRSNTSGN